MFSWAMQRQLIYGFIVFVFLAIAIGVPVYLKFFNQQPTCFDGIQNGTELGVDCGGECSYIRACPQQVIDKPIVMWARPFSVAGGIHNLVAYLQNPNVSFTADPIPYIFTVYDDQNVLLGVREGFVKVPPMKSFPVFEGAFSAGARKPAKVLFEFTGDANWKSYENRDPELLVSDERFRTTISGPRVDAYVTNKTINTYRDIEVVAILYDEKNNAQASSRTYIDVLFGGGQRPVVFTWPEDFNFSVNRIEIVPKLQI
jgi:hypothetical protein